VADAGNTNISGALSLLGSNAGDLSCNSGRGGAPQSPLTRGRFRQRPARLTLTPSILASVTPRAGSSLILGGVLTNNAGKTITVGNNALTLHRHWPQWAQQLAP